jgi:hypothetical protein
MAKGSSGLVTETIQNVILVVAVAIPIITSQNITGLDSSTQTLYNLVPMLLVVFVVVMRVIKNSK